ncbi:UNVERIFIED_CONTAM: putative mitochondrial-processing peptidase subunit beta, mitochondrial [Sesamum angustifolium]|uniref:Mitochondrial-processing peptidase subunit beta, mitochondrial n=1 Tax=Sesamum angustifolium TaxID=2727405 RepID=A0AAW2RLN8_9LAMI
MKDKQKKLYSITLDGFTAFQYTPLGRTILGPAENVKSIGKEHLRNYISTHSTLLLQNGSRSPLVLLSMKMLLRRMLNDDIPLAQFAVAFEGASWTDPDSIALMVMQSMLGSWNKNAGGGKHMGSELAQRVGINEIAESMMAFNTNYKDTGLFGVYAVAKPDCLDDLAYAIMYEITKLCYRVSEADVVRARNQLKSSLLLHIDGTSPVAEDIGRQLLTYGRRIPYAELFARIDAVDATLSNVLPTVLSLIEMLQLAPWVPSRACQTTTGSGAGPTGSVTRFLHASNRQFTRSLSLHLIQCRESTLGGLCLFRFCPFAFAVSCKIFWLVKIIKAVTTRATWLLFWDTELSAAALTNLKA